MNEWIKSEAELEGLRESGARLSIVLAELALSVVPGISTRSLGEEAERLIRKQGGMPIFKGYGSEWGKPFPAAICISVNEEVVHGIPSARILREGDILKLDIGMRYQGMVTDMARTFPVGVIAPDAARLITATKESLDLGISKIRSGARLSQFAQAVESRVKQGGFSVVRDLVGHGVGRELHEEPNIPNYFVKGMENFSFRKGMSVALEPMVNMGRSAVRLADDGWTYKTADGSLSAHFEDTLIITESGVEIVTRTSHE